MCNTVVFFLLLAEVATKKNVTVRKVTRASPDSDDSFADESPDGYLGGRDDQFLVSDRSENKFYGKSIANIIVKARVVNFYHDVNCR